MDFSKAFDSVRHSVLIQKMASLTIPDNILNWIISFLEDRIHCTNFNELVSLFAEICASIIQGSRISPAAYVVNAGDLHPINPDNRMSKFADDSRLIVPACNSHTCESELANIEQWSAKNNLQLNRSKSSEIIFYAKQRRTRPPADIPTLAGIPRVTRINVLGVTLSDDLTFHEHIGDVIKSAAGSLYAMRQLKAYGMRDELIQKVFSASALAKVQYCSPAWWGFVDSGDKERLEAFIAKAKKANFCSKDVPSFGFLCEAADETLFRKVIAEHGGECETSTSNHVLHHLLPPKKPDRATELRPRMHNYELPSKKKFLGINSNNFLTRMLYSCSTVKTDPQKH